jgi:hypothetical protein
MTVARAITARHSKSGRWGFEVAEVATLSGGIPPVPFDQTCYGFRHFGIVRVAPSGLPESDVAALPAQSKFFNDLPVLAEMPLFREKMQSLSL